ncbi:anti-sigma factor [Fulvitalea axinellae]|uniref:Anti-sigma factor n=1 Tax=Fulvitalea axinellae TaxID=1182444 RepID=A0AAU9CQG5_9BACT|nr:anti-sigma factor [Fulvitalea axinellae]
MMDREIVNFLNGELSAEEAERFRLWLEASEKNRALFESYRLADKSSERLAHLWTQRFDKAEGRRILSEKIDNRKVKNVSRKKIGKSSFGTIRLAVAAGLTLLFVAGVLLIGGEDMRISLTYPSISSLADRQKIGFLSLVTADGHVYALDSLHDGLSKKGFRLTVQGKEWIYKPERKIRDSVKLQRLVSPPGVRSRIVLGDGTSVALNGGTDFWFPEGFDREKRVVYVRGEALFKVAHDEDRPFEVRTVRSNVRVLGTEFNVSSYDSDSVTSTTLVEGSVAIFRPGQMFLPDKALRISPGTMATVQKGKIVLTYPDLDRITAWTKEALVFRHTDFREMIPKIERWYGIKIVNEARSLDRKRFTGTFRKETVVEMLETIRKTVDFRYTYDKRKRLLILKEASPK